MIYAGCALGGGLGHCLSQAAGPLWARRDAWGRLPLGTGQVPALGASGVVAGMLAMTVYLAPSQKVLLYGEEGGCGMLSTSKDCMLPGIWRSRLPRPCLALRMIGAAGTSLHLCPEPQACRHARTPPIHTLSEYTLPFQASSLCQCTPLACSGPDWTC